MPWTNADDGYVPAFGVLRPHSSAHADPCREVSPGLLPRRGSADARSSSTRTVYRARIPLYFHQSRKVSTSQIHRNLSGSKQRSGYRSRTDTSPTPD